MIVLPFEGGPLVILDALADGEHQRMLDWIESHPDLLGLAAKAIRIAEEWRAS